MQPRISQRLSGVVVQIMGAERVVEWNVVRGELLGEIDLQIVA